MHRITKPIAFVSHAYFNKSPHGFRPRGKVRLRFSPEVNCREQIGLKARTNQHASSFSTWFTLRSL